MKPSDVDTDTVGRCAKCGTLATRDAYAPCNLTPDVTFKCGGACHAKRDCGLHRTNPGPRRCVERNGEKATWARGKVVLTVAHLNADGGPCRCDPLCGNPEHLKAMCQRCHLRYDHPMHVRNARATVRGKKAAGDLFAGKGATDDR